MKESKKSGFVIGLTLIFVYIAVYILAKKYGGWIMSDEVFEKRSVFGIIVDRAYDHENRFIKFFDPDFLFFGAKAIGNCISAEILIWVFVFAYTARFRVNLLKLIFNGKEYTFGKVIKERSVKSVVFFIFDSLLTTLITNFFMFLSVLIVAILPKESQTISGITHFINRLGEHESTFIQFLSVLLALLMILFIIITLIPALTSIMCVVFALAGLALNKMYVLDKLSSVCPKGFWGELLIFIVTCITITIIMNLAEAITLKLQLLSTKIPGMIIGLFRRKKKSKKENNTRQDEESQ